MDIQTYQLVSARTLNLKLSVDSVISEMVFGMNGEIGEVTEIMKKHLFQGHELNKEHLKEEIGDVMWYLVNLCTIYNIQFTDILDINNEKLNKRYPYGFTTNRSIRR